MKTFVPDEKPASRRKTVAWLIVLAAVGVLVATGKIKISFGENATGASPQTKSVVSSGGTPAVVPAPPAKIHNLLERVDIERGTVHGQWSLKDGELFSDTSLGARIQIPFEVPDEYDLVCEFTRLSGNSTFNLLLAQRGRKFGYCLGWKDASCHFFDVNRPGPNPTSRPLVIQNGQRCSVRIEVRESGVAAYIEGKKVCALATNFTDMSRWNGWDLKNNNYVGIGTWESPAVIHKLDMIEIKGAVPLERANEF